MIKKNISLSEVYDRFAVRIIYNSNNKNEKLIAWKIYSIVTDVYRPNPTRLRDWISNPKTNGYEALHITVVGPRKRWIEVQIRSDRMHEIAERGYAAHFKYKQGDEQESGLEEWLNKLKDVLENQESNAIDFVEDFKLNLYSNEIFVFTPEGDLKSLPKGASALDFAFAVHTDLGLKTRGVKVNGKIVPLNFRLKSGDQVQVIKSTNSKPSASWLDYVEKSLSGLLEPDIKETVLGSAEIQKIFKVSNAGKIAGSKVLSGEIKSKSKARIIRDGVVVHNGEILSIYREKNQVKEVGVGLECGISIKDFIDFKEKDVIESYLSEEIGRTI